MECLAAELARLTGIVKVMEMRITKETEGRCRKEQCNDKKDEDRRLRGGRARASTRKTNGERTTENMAWRKVTGEKVTVEEEGKMGQERREVHVTGGKMKGRKEVGVDVEKGKSITGMMTGRKEAGKKVDATRRSYSEAVIEGALRIERVFMGDSILRKTDKTLSKGENVVVCLPEARIEHVTERIENTLGGGQGGSILVHVGANNADREGTTRIVQRYRQLVGKLKNTRAEQIILSGILPVMGGRGATYRNCKRMAINALVEQMCEDEGVGFLDLWGYFVGKENMYVRDGLHLSGMGATIFSENLLRSMDSGTGCNYVN